MVGNLYLETLINEGEGFKRYVRSVGSSDNMITPEYFAWVSKCVELLEKDYSKDPVTRKFIYASQNPKVENYHCMLQLLKDIRGCEKKIYSLDNDSNDAYGC